MSTTQDATAIPTGTWSLDPTHSDIGFAVSYSSLGTFRGTFDQYDVTFADGQIDGTAQVASVAVDDPNLAGHLQSPDFFDAEQHPELSFRSTSIERDGDKVSIAGELTLRGVTKDVTIDGTVAGPGPDLYGNERVAFNVETIVDRTEYGISWNADLPTGEPALANDVTLTANLAFVQS